MINILIEVFFCRMSNKHGDRLKSVFWFLFDGSY